jgi:hypothetical protein
MVTIPQLLSVDLNALHAVAEDWRWISWRLGQLGQETDESVTQPIRAGNRWSGDDAKAAATHLDDIYKDIKAVGTEAEAVGKFFDDVATGGGDGFGDLKEHQKRAHQLVNDAMAHGMQVDGDGSVTWSAIRASGPLSPAEQQQMKEKQATAHSIEEELKKILEEVNGIDEALTYGLQEIFGTRDTFRTEDRNRHTAGRNFETSWIETKLTAVIADLRLHGWNDAANLLQHYINNTGEPYTVDADRMLNDVPQFQKDVNATLAQVRKLPDGKFQTDWGTSAPNLDDGGNNKNWYYALNHFKYRLVGEKHDGQITYHVDVQKRYDWGIPSEHRRPLNGGPLHFEQADIARLNMVGEASDFDVHGQTSAKTTR